MVVLEEQDRSMWVGSELEEGTKLLERALRMRRAGPYQVQAAIAAVHCRARTAEETDWDEIVALYGELYRMHPTPVVAINRAVAVAMAETPAAGLRLMDDPELRSALDEYRWYHTARADLLRRAGQGLEAAVAYRRALDLTTSEVEQKYLQRRLREVQP